MIVFVCVVCGVCVWGEVVVMIGRDLGIAARQSLHTFGRHELIDSLGD